MKEDTRRGLKRERGAASEGKEHDARSSGNGMAMLRRFMKGQLLLLHIKALFRSPTIIK